MKFNVHAGHNPDGKAGSGAVSRFCKESTENRKIVKALNKELKKRGHTVYDCTVNTGKNASDVLTKIVKKCNKHVVDLDVSIHLNIGRKDLKGDGKTGGSEVLLYSLDYTDLVDKATAVCKNLKKLGFNNRSVKVRPELYFLRYTNAKAMLIEVYFIDDKDDYNTFKKVGYDKIAKAICDAIAPVTLKPYVTIAREVLAGKWGNGAARKKKLEKAGYDYEKVRKEVNRIYYNG